MDAKSKRFSELSVQYSSIMHDTHTQKFFTTSIRTFLTMSDDSHLVGQLELLSEEAEANLYDNPELFYDKIEKIRLFAEENSFQDGFARYTIYKAIWYFRILDYEKSLELTNEALSYAFDCADSISIAKALHNLANIHYSKGQLINALEEYHNAYSTLVLANETKKTFPLLYNISNCYRRLGENHIALEYAGRAYSIALQNSSKKDIISCKLLLATVHHGLGDIPLSLQFNLEAYADAKEIDDKSTIRWAISSIGLMYYRIEEYTTALHYLMESMTLAEKVNDVFLLTDTYRYISAVFRGQKNYPLALNYAMRSLAFNEKRGEIVKQAYDLGAIAQLFFDIGDLNSSKEYAKKSLALHKTESVPIGETDMLHLLSEISISEKEFEESLRYAKESYHKSKELKSSFHRISLDLLFELYTITNNSEELKRIQSEREYITTLENRDTENKEIKKILTETEINNTKKQAETLLNSFTKGYQLTEEVLGTVSTINHINLSNLLSFQNNNDCSTQATIQVSTLGKFCVTINGNELSSDNWKRKKARDIFKILLLHYNQPVTTDELIEILWKDSSEKNILPTIWNSISYIRKALEPDIKPFTPSTYITITNGAYTLNLGDKTFIDFIEFRRLIHQSKNAKEPEKASEISELEKAIDLYKGDFLKEDLFEEWTTFERENLKELFLSTCCRVSNYYLQTENFIKSVEFSRKAIQFDNIYDEGHKLLLRCLHKMKNEAELQKAWKFCQRAYQKELQSPPPDSIHRAFMG